MRLYRDEMKKRLPPNPRARSRFSSMEDRFAWLEGELQEVIEADDPMLRAAEARDLIRKIEFANPQRAVQRIGDEQPTGRIMAPVDVVPPDLKRRLHEIDARRRARRIEAASGR